MHYLPQSTHRVAMAAFWCTYYHEGKNRPDGRGGGGARCTPSPFHCIYHHVQSCGVPYAPAEGADTHSLFLLYPYMYSVVSPQSSCSTVCVQSVFFYLICQCCGSGFGPIGSVSFWITRIWYSPYLFLRIRILPSSSKKSKKNLQKVMSKRKKKYFLLAS
jgi:hypothetical protein